MLFPVWLFSSVFTVFPAGASEQKRPSTTFAQDLTRSPWGDLCNSAPPRAAPGSDCERFLFPAAWEPEATSGNLRRLQVKGGPRGRGARARAERNERAEPERSPAEAGVITAAGAHAAFIYVSFECSWSVLQSAEAITLQVSQSDVAVPEAPE